MRRFLFCDNCLRDINLFSTSRDAQRGCFARWEEAVNNDDVILDNIVGGGAGELDDVGD